MGGLEVKGSGGLLVFCRVLCVGTDGIDVCHDYVGAVGVLVKVVVLAIEAEGDRVVWIE